MDAAPPGACANARLDFGPTIKIIKACVLSYIESRQLWFLALANYVLDYWCTSVLYSCCKRQQPIATNTMDDENDDLIVDVMPTRAVLEECNDFLTKILKDFERLHTAASPGKPVTPDDVKRHVEGTICNYNQFGYGLYRLMSSAKGDLHVKKQKWGNWREYGICNCLVVSLLSGVIAQHYNIPEIITCRMSPAGNNFLRGAQKAQSILPGSSLQSILPYNHLEFFGEHRRGHRSQRSLSTDVCHSIYNFVLMPLEWMIVDSLSRGLCDERHVKVPYAQHLSSFREHLLKELESVMPPKCQSRFHALTSQQAATKRDLRRQTRKRLAGMGATISFPSDDSDQSNKAQTSDDGVD